MNQQDQARPSSSDSRFLMIAGVLLLIILALLAGLWLTMRHRALSAERELAELRRKNRNYQGILARMLLEKRPRFVRRELLSRRKLSVDGRTVAALELPLRTARELGFRPGDVIVVEKVASKVTTRPSGGSLRPQPPPPAATAPSGKEP